MIRSRQMMLDELEGRNYFPPGVLAAYKKGPQSAFCRVQARSGWALCIDPDRYGLFWPAVRPPLPSLK
jgi:hypothetical protein